MDHWWVLSLNFLINFGLNRLDSSGYALDPIVYKHQTQEVTNMTYELGFKTDEAWKFGLCSKSVADICTNAGNDNVFNKYAKILNLKQHLLAL